MPQQIPDNTILEAALAGFEAQRARLDEQISAIRKMIGSAKRASKVSAPVEVASEATPRKKRVLSAAARKRIAEAQKKRWAAFRKQEGQSETAPAAKAKRAGRKRRAVKAG